MTGILFDRAILSINHGGKDKYGLTPVVLAAPISWPSAARN